MSNDAVISKVLALPVKAQRAIWEALDGRFGGDVTLTPKQEQEFMRRLDRFDKDGPRGDSWEVVEKRLQKVIKNARRSHRPARRG